MLIISSIFLSMLFWSKQGYAQVQVTEVGTVLTTSLGNATWVQGTPDPAGYVLYNSLLENGNADLVFLSSDGTEAKRFPNRSGVTVPYAFPNGTVLTCSQIDVTTSLVSIFNSQAQLVGDMRVPACAAPFENERQYFFRLSPDKVALLGGDGRQITGFTVIDDQGNNLGWTAFDLGPDRSEVIDEWDTASIPGGGFFSLGMFPDGKANFSYYGLGAASSVARLPNCGSAEIIAGSNTLLHCYNDRRDDTFYIFDGAKTLVSSFELQSRGADGISDYMVTHRLNGDFLLSLTDEGKIRRYSARGVFEGELDLGQPLDGSMASLGPNKAAFVTESSPNDEHGSASAPSSQLVIVDSHLSSLAKINLPDGYNNIHAIEGRDDIVAIGHGDLSSEEPLDVETLKFYDLHRGWIQGADESIGILALDIRPFPGHPGRYYYSGYQNENGGPIIRILDISER